MMFSFRAVTLFAVILMATGCSVGKTSTMFITKTNAGLELSYEPPTLALDISRIEGVLGPQFENGKKLPVLASFKFKNSGAFAPHLGSTFATGDAAVVLAAFYGDQTTPDQWNERLKQVKTLVDSSLELDNKPNPGTWHSFQKAENGTGLKEVDVKTVFFGTDTMLGLKVAWSTMTGALPDSAKLGYNRKEFALLPISMAEENSDDNKKYRMKMAPLLATLDAPIDANTGAQSLETSYIQYFATGEAATLLAFQQDVRRAMLVRLDPNQNSYLRKFGEGLGRHQEYILPYTLSAFYDTLIKLKQSGDSVAAAHKEKLDGLVSELPIPSTFTAKNLYRYRYVSPTLTRSSDDSIPYDKNTDFYKVIRYWTDLESSLRAIETAINEKKDGALQCDPPAACDSLDEERKRLDEARNEIAGAVRENRQIIAAYSYFQALISP
ncbi:MAG: hypothetical protein K9L59_02255 [Desulfobacterales bacterium]|nr:hypothetical protein [Desulfobacterales bacterium]